MGREADNFELGKAMYWLVLIADAFLWQLFFLGAIGVIFCHSSLLSGILIAALLPVSEILAVFFFDESFTVEKAMSLFLACWGSISYFFEEYNLEKKKKRESQDQPVEMKDEKKKCVVEDELIEVKLDK